MDFLPRRIHRGTNSDGTSYRIEEWGRDGIGFVELPTGLGWFSTLAVLGFTLPILSLFTRNLLLNAISIVFGLYLIKDFNEYWLFSRFYMIFFSDSMMLLIISAVLVSTILNMLKLVLDLVFPPNIITFVGIILLFFIGTSIDYQDTKENNTYFNKRNIELKR